MKSSPKNSIVKILLATSFLLLLALVGRAEEQDSVLIRKYLDISGQLYRQNPDSALYYNRLACELARKYEGSAIQLDAILSLGNRQLLTGEIGDGVSNMELVFKHPAATPLDRYKSLVNQSGIYLAHWNDPMMAIRFLLQAKEIAEEEGLENRLPRIYHNLGSAFSRIEDFENAEKYFLAGLPFQSRPITRAGTHFNIASDALVTGDTMKAIEYNSKARDIWLEQSADHVFFAYSLYVEIYSTKDLELASLYVDSMMASIPKREMNSPLFKAMSTKGFYHLKVGQCDSAIFAYQGGLADARSRGSWVDVGEALEGLLEAYICLGNTKMVAETALAIKETNKQKIKEERQQTREQVAKLMEDQNELKDIRHSATELENKATSAKQTTMLIGLMLLAAVGVLIYVIRLTRQKSQINNKLNEANLENHKLLEQVITTNSGLQSANEEVLNLNRRLEEKVNSRTKELEEKNVKLKNYVFWNAHRLRAALANVSGLVNLLDVDKVKLIGEDREEVLRLLADSVQKLDGTVKEFNDKLS